MDAKVFWARRRRGCFIASRKAFPKTSVGRCALESSRQDTPLPRIEKPIAEDELIVKGSKGSRKGNRELWLRCKYISPVC
jgi:hypothetical protein